MVNVPYHRQNALDTNKISALKSGVLSMINIVTILFHVPDKNNVIRNLLKFNSYCIASDLL